MPQSLASSIEFPRAKTENNNSNNNDNNNNRIGLLGRKGSKINISIVLSVRCMSKRCISK